jgi:hypothetical protein
MKVQSRAAGLEASKFVEKHEAATMKSVDEEAANKFDPIIYFNYSVLYTKERVRKNSTDHKSPPRLARRPRPLSFDIFPLFLSSVTATTIHWTIY